MHKDETVVAKDSALLQKTIGYTFGKPEILREALTHSSLANETRAHGAASRCNERFEFLGDSILQILTSEYLFLTFPDSPEGELTKIRAAVVCEEALWQNAQEISLGDYLLLGHGEEKNGGRTRKSISADAFEALLAAIYLDSGSLARVSAFLMPFVIRREEALHGHTHDYKTQLQQIVQQAQGELLEYVLISESGPDHDKTFVIEAHLNSNIIGHGEGRSKREAEQAAAREALSLFGDGTKTE